LHAVARPANAEFTRPAPPVSRIRFETTKGVFVLELHRNQGPHGADRLYNLARLGYFTDTRFLRARDDVEPFTILGTVVEGMSMLDSVYSGYGEDSGSGARQGEQGPLERGSNAHMDREFPELDHMVRVTVSPFRS